MFVPRATRSLAASSPLTRARVVVFAQSRSISQTPHRGAPGHNELKEFPKSYTHYQILGVDHTADSKTVKNAFRKLSKRFHPDVNQRAPTALKPIIKNNYIRIVASYETLSDSAKRTAYDSKLNINVPRDSSRYANNAANFSPAAKTYSPGGINITRNKVYYGPGYRRSRSTHTSHLHDTSPSGSNYDVPHFDYDTHLKGNLWFERRMIQKKFMKKTSKPQEPQTTEWFQENFQKHNKTTVEAEVNDTLNLQRYGGHHHRGQTSYTITAGPLMLTTLTILTMGMYMH